VKSQSAAAFSIEDLSPRDNVGDVHTVQIQSKESVRVRVAVYDETPASKATGSDLGDESLLALGATDRTDPREGAFRCLSEVTDEAQGPSVGDREANLFPQRNTKRNRFPVRSLWSAKRR
jgi:hypothetical protein